MKSALMQDWVNKISQADVSTVQQVLIIFPIHDVLLPLIARVFTPTDTKTKQMVSNFQTSPDPI